MGIIKYGGLHSEILNYKCTPVKHFDRYLKTVVSEMRQALGSNKGIGLAANQIALPYQIIIIKLPGKGNKKKLKRGIRFTIINPQYAYKSDKKIISKESCLSLPGICRNISRHKCITICYQDIEGEHQEITAEGLLARCIQHEIDHLNGITLMNRSPLS